MGNGRIRPVYLVIDPNARENTKQALKELAVEKLLRRIETDRSQ